MPMFIGILSAERLAAIAKQPFTTRSDDKTLRLDDLEPLWAGVVFTACSPVVTDKHLTAACNALCSVLRRASQSTNHEVRQHVYSRQTWFDAYGAAHKAFRDGKTKPGLQVLDMLVEFALSNSMAVVGPQILQDAAGSLVAIILTNEPAAQLKEACTILNSFVRRASPNILSITRVFQFGLQHVKSKFKRRCLQNNVQSIDWDGRNYSALRAAFLALLFAINSPETRTAALKLFSCLYIQSDEEIGNYLVIANEMIEVFIGANEAASGEFAKDIFSTLLTNEKSLQQLLALYGPQKCPNTSQILIYLALLETGRAKAFLNEEDMLEIMNKSIPAGPLIHGPGLEKYATLQMLLTSTFADSRIRACTLLMMSPTTTTPVSSGVLRCLVANVRYIHDDTDAYQRGELISIFKKFFDRSERSWQTLKRTESKKFSGSLYQTLQEYTTFFTKYMQFLISELSVQASYQRHILALNLLKYIVKLNYSEPELFQVIPHQNADLLKSLFLLILDPYEDTRGNATYLLQQIAKHDARSVLTILRDNDIISKAVRLCAITNRSDHSDALGRLLMLSVLSEDAAYIESNIIETGYRGLGVLIQELEDFVSSVTKLSPEATFPLHGQILGVTYCLFERPEQASANDKYMVSSLLHICQKLWELVQEHLCIDSPEVENDEADEENFVGPKDTLSYCWRALRDSSLMLQAILLSLPGSLSTYRAIGDLCFRQLADLRHRGAFSTVAQTFTLCCQKVRDAKDVEVKALNQKWYTASIDEIRSQANRLTRRSAGLPSMVMGVLEPRNVKIFSDSMLDLLSIANLACNDLVANDTNATLPEVHALNCLKDIMINSRFKVVSEAYNVQLLDLASQCLGSKIWAVRNCGLMLFRACIARLGTESGFIIKNEDASIRTEETLPSPLSVAINLLSVRNAKWSPQVFSDNSQTSEIIFAALDLLGRIGTHDSEKSKIQELVHYHLGSHIWHVREQAALLLASQTDESDRFDKLSRISESIAENDSRNETHGNLLTCRYICQQIWRESEPSILSRCVERVSKNLAAIFDNFTSFFCAVIRGACLDIVNDMLAAILQTDDAEAIKLVPKISQRFFLNNAYARSPLEPSFLYLRAAALREVYVFIGCAEEMADDDKPPQCNGLHAGRDAMLSILGTDDDVAAYVMDHLQSMQKLPEAMINILASFAVSTSSGDLYTTALYLLSSYLPHFTTRLSIQTLQSAVNLIRTSKTKSRDSQNAQIRWFAALLRHVCQFDEDTTFQEMLQLQDRYLRALQVAAEDDVETPTRQNAMASIADLVACSSPRHRLSLPDDQFLLELLTILYNFLNDDDEHIRYLAVEACNAFVFDKDMLTWSTSLATREALLNTIFARFKTSDLLLRHALHKISGLQMSHEDNALLPSGLDGEASVEARLLSILIRANDLFAEERQNLYRDEIAELMDWSTHTMTRRLLDLDPDRLRPLTNWVCKGLDTLAGLLSATQQGGGFDRGNGITLRFGSKALSSNEMLIGPLGLSYEPEIHVLMMRVVIMGGIILGATHSSASDCNVDVRKKLEEFREMSTRTDVNPQILSVTSNSLSRT